jgi:two-component system LytT family sensor kinase
MIPTYLRPLVELLHENRDYRFWVCQLVGWTGYGLATFFSITLVDDNVSWPHVGHIGLSVVLGIFTSWTLRPLYRHTFDFALYRRVIVATLAVLVLSLVWTFLRIEVFALIVGEVAVWREFHYWFFGSLFVFLSWSVLYYGIKYYELLLLEHQKLVEESALKEREHFRRLRAESSARDAQLQMLRYQLTPHFLFNTLNSINALVTLRETEKAGEMIRLLSDFLRHSLEQDSVKSVSLERELEALMLYLNIEKIRFEDRLSLEFEIDPLALQAQVPGLILQPLVENSMKYAIATSEDGGTVRVTACVQDDQLQLEVSDTGPGIKSSANEEDYGVGLRNTRDRLETLYAENYSLSTANISPSGLAVQIRFPFHLAPGERDHPETLQ